IQLNDECEILDKCPEMHSDDLVVDENPGEIVIDENYDTVASDNQQETEEGARRGPGRPKKIYTGNPGRPRLQFNMLNIMTTDDIAVPCS
ncbi:hypothetical protein KR044_006733, partial [Drosophila immigrans]